MSDKVWSVEEQAEHRKLWADALRSGLYPQCQQVLSNKYAYCCLGVACEVALNNGLELYVDRHPLDEYGEPIDHVVYNGEWENLPKSVHEWLGLDGLNFDDIDLINMNDHENKTFDEIADFIEANKPQEEEEDEDG